MPRSGPVPAPAVSLPAHPQRTISDLPASVRSTLETLDQLLLDACSPHAEAAKTRVPPQAWPELLARAEAHKVSNLVLARWETRTSDLSEDVRARRRRAAAGNLAYAGRLLELISLHEKAGIPALPFKGPVLAETVFGGIPNRSFRDLDLLVPRAELGRACILLIDLGYRPLHDVGLAEYLRITLRGGHHVGLRHQRHGTHVELHWEMAGRYLPVDLDWETVEPFLGGVGFCEREVLTLSPETGLLYLCVHGAKEYWRILDHVVCVAWHLERRPPDWNRVLDLARRWGGERILLTGLGLAAQLFEVTLPKAIAGMITVSPAVRRLVERQSRRIFAEDRLTTLRLDSLPEFLRMHWTQLGDPVHFLRWVARRMTTPAVEDLERAEPPAQVGDDSPKTVFQMADMRAPMQAVRRLVGRRG